MRVRTAADRIIDAVPADFMSAVERGVEITIRVEKLQVIVEAERMCFTITPFKAKPIERTSTLLLRQAVMTRRWVNAEVVCIFCVMCANLSLTLP